MLTKRKQFFRCALILLTLTVLARADIAFSTTCQLTLPGQTLSQVDTNSCSVTDKGTRFQADAFIGGVAFSPGFGDELGGGFWGQVYAYPPTADPNTYATSSASGTSEQALYTNGPVRSGFLQYNESVTLDAGTSSGSNGFAEIAVGPFRTSCLAQGIANCTGNFGGSHGLASGMLPFTLGQTFDISASLTLLAFGNSTQGPSGGSGTLGFDFYLFESDGVTPVQAYLAPTAIPEPNVGLLFIGGVTLFLGLRRAGHYGI